MSEPTAEYRIWRPGPTDTLLRPSYDLSSYRKLMDRMIAQAVELLLTRIQESSHSSREVKWAGKLILRGSTRNKRA